MTRTLAVLVLAAVCLGFTPAAAKAQPLRRLFAPQTCPNCPNGVCQPQPSGPMFAAGPATPPTPLPSRATAVAAAPTSPCPCTATTCAQGAPCPCGVASCTCNPTRSTVALASACSTGACATASAGSGRAGWFGLGVIGPGTGRGLFRR